MTTQPRIRLDDLTSEALDALYARLDLLEAGRDERVALLEEARDALEAAGAARVHGDDWPRLALAIEELTRRADTAEARVRELEANTATLQDALAAVTGQCRSLETELAAERSTIDRVRDLAGRYQMWHEGGWSPSSAADVAREYRAAVDGQADGTGNTSPAAWS